MSKHDDRQKLNIGSWNAKSNTDDDIRKHVMVCIMWNSWNPISMIKVFKKKKSNYNQQLA